MFLTKSRLPDYVCPYGENDKTLKGNVSAKMFLSLLKGYDYMTLYTA